MTDYADARLVVGALAELEGCVVEKAIIDWRPDPMGEDGLVPYPALILSHEGMRLGTDGREGTFKLVFARDAEDNGPGSGYVEDCTELRDDLGGGGNPERLTHDQAELESNQLADRHTIQVEMTDADGEVTILTFAESAREAAHKAAENARLSGEFTGIRFRDLGVMERWKQRQVGRGGA